MKAGQPEAGGYPEHPAEEAEQPCLDHEQAPDGRPCRTARAQDADLAGTFEDRHHHRVDDPDRGDRERDGADGAQHQAHDVEDLQLLVDKAARGGRLGDRAAARWHAEDRPLTISVNVSPNCLLDEGFATRVGATFVKDLASDSDDAMLVRSAIDLAHNLGLFVTAEGVEDFAALTMLRDLGCDFAQGFALARPVPADHFAAACDKAEKIARAVLLPRQPASSATAAIRPTPLSAFDRRMARGSVPPRSSDNLDATV
jgi:hypothetical protein